jgi:probable LLM family oxidoreductase
VELGVYTFAELTSDEVSPQQRLDDLIEEIELADQVGLDVFGVGEHHRPDFAVSSPAVVLAAAAARTKTIRLTSAVSVISSDDPVRVFQDFATLDLLSGGRAEIMAGRASFIESFPLFGYDLRDYDDLFEEKLRLLLALRESERISWPGGGHRAAIDDRGVYPRPLQDPLPVWVAVGGSPESAARAGILGLPMALAIIGDRPERFVPFAELHRRAAEQAGHGRLALSINSHGFIADTAQEALDDSFPFVTAMMDRIGRERGWPPHTRQDYDAAATLRGSNFVGNPEQIVEKILFQYGALPAQPVPRPVQRRHDAAREDHALDRALRDRGCAGRAPRAFVSGGTSGDALRSIPVGDDATEPKVEPAALEQARSALNPLLKRVAKEMRTTGRDVAVEFLCAGLEAIPVPILNVALSKSVRRMLAGSPGNPPAELQEVLQLLEEMQRSDEAFEEGIGVLRIDLAEVAADVRAIREEMTDQRLSRLELVRVRTALHWPVFDNQISALLANVGGGAVVVDEIIIRVEGWEPEPTVDYSVPAAPLLELHLQAELNTRESDYGLFALNGVGSRIFDERGAGAERVVIDLSSPENVRYSLRLHVPFMEITTGTTGTLVWPPAEAPPAVFPFVCGPGWQNVDVTKLHAADAIFEDMTTKLSGLADALAARPSEPGYDPGFEASLEELGIPSYIGGGFIFGHFLHRFVPLFAQLAASDDREHALSIVGALLAAAPQESLADVPADGDLASALIELARGTPKEPIATELASRLADPTARAVLGQELRR